MDLTLLSLSIKVFEFEFEYFSFFSFSSFFLNFIYYDSHLFVQCCSYSLECYFWRDNYVLRFQSLLLLLSEWVIIKSCLHQLSFA